LTQNPTSTPIPTATAEPIPTATPEPVRTAEPTPVWTAEPTLAPTPTPAPVTFDLTVQEAELFGLVNSIRIANGLTAIELDPNLQLSARMKATDMIADNYFAHQSPTYGSPFDLMKLNGVQFTCAGENLAGNTTVQAAFDAWMLSPGHRANILSPDYKFTGIAICPHPEYGLLLVQMFVGR
jgi:uncharacterized YkwD family protein